MYAVCHFLLVVDILSERKHAFGYLYKFTYEVYAILDKLDKKFHGSWRIKL